MKRFIRKLNTACKIFVLAFMSDNSFTYKNLKMITSLYEMIFRVAKEYKPLMTHIAYIHPIDGKEESLVSLWAGSGYDASPIKRIDELRKEIEMLRAELEKHNNQKIEK